MKRTTKSFLALLAIIVLLISALMPSSVFAARSLNGSISGFVLNQAGKPVANTVVVAYQRQWEATDGFGTPCWTKFIAMTRTGKGGTYKMNLPAGEYRIWFIPNDLDTYAMEAYPDSAYIAVGDNVTVKSGQTTSRVSVTLDTPGKITGHIVDAIPDSELGYLPLGNIPVSLCVQDTCIINCLETVNTAVDDSGYFEIKGVKPFPWMLWVNVPFYCKDPSKQPEPSIGYQSGYKDFQMYCFDKYTWLPNPGTVEMIDLNFDWDPETPSDNVIKLEPIDFANVQGTIIDAVSGSPVEGLQVRTMVAAYDPAGDQTWEEGPEAVAPTDTYGRFTIEGLCNYRGRVVLYTDGNATNQQYYNEYYFRADSELSAEQMEIHMGEKIEGIVWPLIPQLPE